MRASFAEHWNWLCHQQGETERWPGSLCFCGTGWEGAAASVPGSALPQFGLGARRRRLLYMLLLLPFVSYRDRFRGHSWATGIFLLLLLLFFTPPPLFCFAFLSPVPKRGRKRTHHARASREQRSAAAAAAGLGRAAGKSASGTFSGHFTRLRLSRSVPTRFAEFAVLVTPNTLRS